MRIYYLLKKKKKPQHNKTTNSVLWGLTHNFWISVVGSPACNSVGRRNCLQKNPEEVSSYEWVDTCSEILESTQHKPSTSASLFQKMHCAWRVIVSDGCCTGFFFFSPLFTNVDYCPRNQNGHFFPSVSHSHILARAPFISWWSLFILAICFNTVAFPRVHLVT